MADVSATASVDLTRFRARLPDPREHVRLATLAKLLEVGPEAEPALDLLAARLGDTSEGVRRLAVLVLGQIGAPALDALVSALAAGQPVSVRTAAASGLAQIGPEAAPAVDPLTECLASDDEMLRTNAGIALSKIGPAAVPALREASKSDDPGVCLIAVKALGWMGPDAGEAVDDLRELAGSTTGTTQLAISTALVKITEDPANGLPALLAALESEETEVRKAAVEGIGEIGEAAREQAEVLRGCMRDVSPDVRAAAALAAARVNADDDATIAALQQLSNDEEADVRQQASIALASLEQVEENAADG